MYILHARRWWKKGSGKRAEYYWVCRSLLCSTTPTLLPIPSVLMTPRRPRLH